jgi:hypothetical protein
MILECIECGNPRIENRDLGLCASCSAAMRKAHRQATKVKVVTPIKKVSQQQRVKNIEYLKVRQEYLALYPVCEVPECDLKATDIHHQKGKVTTELLMDVNYFMAVCRKHHTIIENNPNWAKENGFSFKRITE